MTTADSTTDDSEMLKAIDDAIRRYLTGQSTEQKWNPYTNGKAALLAILSRSPYLNEQQPENLAKRFCNLSDDDLKTLVDRLDLEKRFPE